MSKGAALASIDFSIIIPLYNQIAFTKVCLEYLLRNTNGEYEVILVDNASSDETPGYIANITGPVQKITNRENLGFAKACNQGARAARGSVLVFLNNDTAVHRGWLGALADTLRNRPEVGIVGPKLIYPDNTIQQAAVVFEENGLPYHLYTGCPADLPGANKPRFFQAVTGACFMISKRDFFEVDCFDEGYVNGLEDIDLCLKIGALGKGVYYNPASLVTHFESRSQGRQNSMSMNRDLFVSRWAGKAVQDDFKYLRQDGMEIRLDDRGSMEFLSRARSEQVVRQEVAAGEVFEGKGDIVRAFDHYKQIFIRSPRSPIILLRLEELSRKVGLSEVAENFRERQALYSNVSPAYGLEYKPSQPAIA
jgi:GT2 family glycosyltransferase